MTTSSRYLRVSDVIEILKTMPPDAKVGYAYDGMVCNAEIAFLSRSNVVVLCEKGDVIYSDKNRPRQAPSESEDPFWSTS